MQIIMERAMKLAGPKSKAAVLTASVLTLSALLAYRKAAQELDALSLFE